jgi:cytochrome c oxidase assembly protein subunit 15
MKNEAGSSRAVANWILAGVFMLVVQVILGGITRLTGSGLSITEWNVATGTIPPINQQQWVTEFNKYRETPQFHLLNPDFSLSDYKFIFFWEWFHRFWARMVGVVFIVGFAYLLLRKQLKPAMIRPLIILFLLGAMQGIIGWIMVKSGLTGDAIYVRPTRLALHFIFALGLICYAFWFALQLRIPDTEIIHDRKLSNRTRAIIVVLFFQLIFGALMAGHKAATVAPTWPTINGNWLPASLFRESPFLFNFVNNKITIQFMHRCLAYLLLVLTIAWTFRSNRVSVHGLLYKTKWLPLAVVLAQAVLGICAVLLSPEIVPNHWGVFEWIAQVHQVTGMIFLLLMLYMLYIVRGGNKVADTRSALVADRY